MAISLIFASLHIFEARCRFGKTTPVSGRVLQNEVEGEINLFEESAFGYFPIMFVAVSPSFIEMKLFL
jgi:hypothetical protein